MNEIIYIYDALCGWCYGFTPVVKLIEKKYSDRLKISVLSGGMMLGKRVGPISEMTKYILDAYKRVEEMSGIKFGEPYLDLVKKGAYIMDSEKPGIALTVFKSYQQESLTEFAQSIQNALFVSGKDLNADETYLELIKKYSISEAEFKQKLSDELFKKQTQEEFDLVARFGISGFPTLLYKKEEDYYLLGQGFRDFDTLDKILQQVI